ncbi:MAG: NAD(P)-binding domain-containing protein [Bacteroidota bacterium]
MNIAIIGTGNVGGALATRWAEAGHQIRLGVRKPEEFKGMGLLQNPRTSVYQTAEAVAGAEVILVATPPQIAASLVEQMGPVSGKVIIDATNAIAANPAPYPTAYHAFAELTDAQVVKCFNTTGYENMAQPDYGNLTLDMFMAGDSDTAKAVARQLAQDCGFEECYDFGQADKVELLEQFALSWINLAIFQKMGRNIGLKLVKRPK